MSTYLQHYGVLGMKWGVRKSKKYVDKYTSRANDNISRIKRYDKLETKRVATNPRNKKYLKDFIEIGRRDWANKLKNEEIFKKKISDININELKYREVKALVRAAEKEHLELGQKSTKEYEQSSLALYNRMKKDGSIR